MSVGAADCAQIPVVLAAAHMGTIIQDKYEKGCYYVDGQTWQVSRVACRVDSKPVVHVAHAHARCTETAKECMRGWKLRSVPSCRACGSAYVAVVRLQAAHLAHLCRSTLVCAAMHATLGVQGAAHALAGKAMR